METVPSEGGATGPVRPGCGRTGPFFSFEPAGIAADIVSLPKPISGHGMPMALTLMRPEYDAWKPGEHAGSPGRGAGRARGPRGA